MKLGVPKQLSQSYFVASQSAHIDSELKKILELKSEKEILSRTYKSDWTRFNFKSQKQLFN